MKQVKKLFYICLTVLTAVSFFGCGNKTVKNNNVQTVSINDFEGDPSERMCQNLTEKSEDILSEIEGIENVQTVVNYDEATNKYSIDVEYSLSEGNEDKAEDTKELMIDILSKTFEFENINIKQIAK